LTDERPRWRRPLIVGLVLAVTLATVLGRFVVAWSTGELIVGSSTALAVIVILVPLGFTGALLAAVTFGIHFLTLTSVRWLTSEFPNAIVVPITSGPDQVGQLRALGATDPLLARTRGMVAVIDSTSISLWKKGSLPRLLARIAAEDAHYEVGTYEYFGRRYRTLRATLLSGQSPQSLDILVLSFDKLIPRMASNEQLSQIISKLALGQ